MLCCYQKAPHFSGVFRLRCVKPSGGEASAQYRISSWPLGNFQEVSSPIYQAVKGPRDPHSLRVGLYSQNFGHDIFGQKKVVRFFSHGVNPLVVDPGMGYMFVIFFRYSERIWKKKHRKTGGLEVFQGMHDGFVKSIFINGFFGWEKRKWCIKISYISSLCDMFLSFLL